MNIQRGHPWPPCKAVKEFGDGLFTKPERRGLDPELHGIKARLVNEIEDFIQGILMEEHTRYRKAYHAPISYSAGAIIIVDGKHPHGDPL